MKLLYVTSISYPSSLANRIQILAMAKEFKRALGSDFILGGNDISGLDSAIYDEPVNLHSSRSFILAWKYLSFMKRLGITHVYCREPKLLFFIQRYNKMFFHLDLAFYFEAHDLPKSGQNTLKKVLAGCAGVVSITGNLKRDISVLCSSQTRQLHAPDGIDLSMFAQAPSYDEARKKLNIPANKKAVIYTGHMYPWKGVYTLGDAAKLLGDDTLSMFIGGKETDIKAFKDEYKGVNDISVIGPKPHSEMPAYLAAADALVLPNSGKEDISKLYTSPMKMFEYMASGRPIIASDLPSIREVLNEDNSILFKADDSASLADAIKKCLNEPELARQVSMQALKDVQNYTWQKRVESIISFMK